MTDESTRDIVSDRQRQEEFQAYLRLRPYLGRLLKLNHDINNSLSGIMGNAEFLCDEAESLTAEQREFAQQIMVCVDRIRDSIEEFQRQSLTPKTAQDLKFLTAALKTLDSSD